MARWNSKLFASFLSLSIILSSGLGVHEAAAQAVAANAASGASASMAGVAGVAAARPVTVQAQLLAPANLVLSPMTSPALAAPAIALPAARPALSIGVAASRSAATATAVPVAALAGAVAAAASEAGAREARAGRGSLGALTESVRKDSPAVGVSASSDWRIGRLFDGQGRRKAGSEDVAGIAVAGRASEGRVSGLARTSSTPEPAPKAAPPAPRTSASRGIGRGLALLGVAALLSLAVPGIALAAVPAAGASLSILAGIHPLASALAAAGGAVYGLIAAHKNGAQPSAGEVLASVLRYGILGGAGVYVLFDLAQVVFMVPGAGLTPLPTAIATAALGQSAFQGKFADASTSPADRLISAFPAVAAALGLSLGMLVAPAALATAAVGAMSLTGVASAVYAALYKPGKSSADGPARMARGYVLQSLMTGLGLTVASPYLAAPFMLLAAWGLWDVLSTTYRELSAAGTDWFNKSGKAK